MMKTVFFVMVLVTGGCDYPSDEQLAAQACAHVVNPIASERCQERYMDRAERNQEMQNMMIGGMILSRQAQTSCMNIGGIITCR